MPSHRRQTEASTQQKSTLQTFCATHCITQQAHKGRGKCQRCTGQYVSSFNAVGVIQRADARWLGSRWSLRSGRPLAGPVARE